MQYIESNLLENERVIFKTSLNFYYLIFPLLFLALFTFTFIINVVNKNTGRASTILDICFIIALIYNISSLLTYKTSEFGVTNKRVLSKFGFIKRTTTETLISKIETIKVDQSIIGRMLNYGNITIIGTGSTKNKFSEIDKPLLFKKNIEEQIDLHLKQNE